MIRFQYSTVTQLFHSPLLSLRSSEIGIHIFQTCSHFVSYYIISSLTGLSVSLYLACARLKPSELGFTASQS